MKLYIFEKETDEKWHEPKIFRKAKEAAEKLRKEYCQITLQLEQVGRSKEFFCCIELESNDLGAACVEGNDGKTFIRWRITEHFI